jgi:BMFP domain-containing protein YqiC
MTTTSSRFFDELAKLMTNAAGAAQSARKEFDSFVRSQIERAMSGMEVVQREEFEAVKEMAAKAREENERLARRLAELEGRIAPPPAV